MENRDYKICDCGAEVWETPKCPDCLDLVCEECGSKCEMCGRLFHTDCLATTQDLTSYNLCHDCLGDAMVALKKSRLKS